METWRLLPSYSKCILRYIKYATACGKILIGVFTLCKNKNYTKRTLVEPGSRHILYTRLVARDKIVLLPLYMNLWLMKYFVQAIMNQEGEDCTYLQTIFLQLSDADIKAETSYGQPIPKLFKDETFIWRPWECSLEICCCNCLGVEELQTTI